jgi:hypothetical protein
MVKMSVEVEGVQRLTRKLEHVLDPLQPELVVLVRGIEAKAREFAKPHAVDKGTLGYTVKSEIAPQGRALYELARVYTRSGIAQTVEEGRRPGKPPPVKAIARWAVLHGVSTKAWHLVQDIRQRGTRGVFFMSRAAEWGEREVERTMRNIALEIRRRWGR